MAFYQITAGDDILLNAYMLEIKVIQATVMLVTLVQKKKSEMKITL